MSSVTTSASYLHASKDNELKKHIAHTEVISKNPRGKMRPVKYNSYQSRANDNLLNKRLGDPKKINRSMKIKNSEKEDIGEKNFTVFFKISINNVLIDNNVVIALTEHDYNKKSVRNFYHLCEGNKGIDHYTSNNLHFKKTKIHRISHIFIQGGDINEGDGSGMTSIYNSDFFETNIDVKDISRKDVKDINRKVEIGDVFASNLGPNTSNSQFFIITKKIKDDPFFKNLHKKYVHIGKVINGFDIVRKISLQPINQKTLEPYPKIMIEECGSIPSQDIFSF